MAADGSFVFEPVTISQLKAPRCFRSLRGPSTPMSVHYFSNSRIWMKSDITKTALAKLDCRMNFENRKIILFFDKGTRHPEGLQNGLTNIKLVFLFKNATSRLQPLDQVLSEILNLSTKNYFFVLSLVMLTIVKLYLK